MSGGYVQGVYRIPAFSVYVLMAKEFLKLRDDDLHYAVLSLSDPGPTLGMLLQGVWFLASKERRDFIFKRGR